MGLLPTQGVGLVSLRDSFRGGIHGWRSSLRWPAPVVVVVVDVGAAVGAVGSVGSVGSVVAAGGGGGDRALGASRSWKRRKKGSSTMEANESRTPAAGRSSTSKNVPWGPAAGRGCPRGGRVCGSPADAVTYAGGVAVVVRVVVVVVVVASKLSKSVVEAAVAAAAAAAPAPAVAPAAPAACGGVAVAPDSCCGSAPLERSARWPDCTHMASVRSRMYLYSMYSTYMAAPEVLDPVSGPVRIGVSRVARSFAAGGEKMEERRKAGRTTTTRKDKPPRPTRCPRLGGGGAFLGGCYRVLLLGFPGSHRGHDPPSPTRGTDTCGARPVPARAAHWSTAFSRSSAQAPRAQAVEGPPCAPRPVGANAAGPVRLQRQAKRASGRLYSSIKPFCVSKFCVSEEWRGGQGGRDGERKCDREGASERVSERAREGGRTMDGRRQEDYQLPPVCARSGKLPRVPMHEFLSRRRQLHCPRTAGRLSRMEPDSPPLPPLTSPRCGARRLSGRAAVQVGN